MALLEHLADGPDLVVLLWPTILGYLRIGTHPSIFADPLSPERATANVESLIALPHVRTAGELEGFWAAYRATAEQVPVRGNLAPDAHLVALMRQHGISTIWSHDRDLRKFGGVTVRDPFTDRYEQGFSSDRRPTAS